MVNTVVYILANLFRVYLIYRFVSIFFSEIHLEKKIVRLAFASFFVINTSLYLVYHLAWVNIICNLLGVFLLLLLYSTNLRLNIFVSTSVIVLAMICDVIATVPFIDYADGETVNTVTFIIHDFMFFICELLAQKIINTKSGKNDNKSFPLIMVPLCSILIIFISVYSERKLDYQIVILSLGLIIINFLVLYLYNMLLEAMIEKYENVMLKEKVAMYVSQLDVIMQTENKVRTMQHDLRHHITELKYLSMKSSNDEMLQYIVQMEEYIKNPDELVASGNVEIDSLLNYMLRRAKEELNEVNTKIDLPKNMKDCFDITVILGNLLENAIEASKESEERLLNVNISTKKGILRIEIENSYSGKLNVVAQKFISTKKKGENHGFGIRSVENIVKKYNGLIEFSTDGVFNVKLILYI